MGGTAGVAILTAALLVAHAPFWMRFRASENAMTRFARQVIANPDTPLPSRVGLYWIETVKTFDGGMGFSVKNAGFIDWGGFAYSPNGRPPGGRKGFHVKHIDGPWYLWIEHF